MWGVKTVLRLQERRDPGLLPESLLSEMEQTRRAPEQFSVAIAMRPREGEWPYRFASSASAATSLPWDVTPAHDAGVDHYRAELCVGHLVIRVAANFTPHARPVDHGPAAMEIWPLGAPAMWPPLRRGLVRLAA